MDATVAPKAVPYENPGMICQSDLIQQSLLTPISQHPIFIQRIDNTHQIPCHESRANEPAGFIRLLEANIRIDFPSRPKPSQRHVRRIPKYPLV
jgi:hypothetical protein